MSSASVRNNGSSEEEKEREEEKMQYKRPMLESEKIMDQPVMTCGKTGGCGVISQS